MTTAQVCEILKACGEVAVTELKFGGLHVKFSPKAEVPSFADLAHARAMQASMDMTPAPQSATEIAGIQTQEAAHALQRDETFLRREQIADLWITNPAKAEELLANGELTEDDATDEET